MRYEPVGHTFGFHLLGRLAEGECLRLREDVRQEYVVVSPEAIQRVDERDEVARDEMCPLMDELIEGVLSIGARLAPVHRSGRRTHWRSVVRDVLAVTLHRQLLQVRGKAFQVL